MNSHGIEAWALRVIDRIKVGLPNEDFRVELKREWIDAKKAARQIAGLANAARGEFVLWLVGVDEKEGVVGALANEMSDWWAQVRSQFDGFAPEMKDLIVLNDGKAIVALLFDSNRRPFVVKNPQGGQISLEVPWREGTAIRSATRSDLIRLLSPIPALPTFEILSAQLSASEPNELQDIDPNHFFWSLNVRVYVTPQTEARIVFPFHRCSSSFEVPIGGKSISFSSVRLAAPISPILAASGFGNVSLTASTSYSELLVSGPGSFDLIAEGGLRRDALEFQDSAKITVSLMPATSNVAAVLAAPLGNFPRAAGQVAAWHFGR